MFDIKSFYEAVSVQDAIQALLKDTDAESSAAAPMY